MADSLPDRFQHAIETSDPEPYRRELGITSVLSRRDIHRLWLLEQLKSTLGGGLCAA